MKIYFIEDENGEYYSSDKTRRFTRIAGKEAFVYLQNEKKRGINRRFLQTESEEIDSATPYDEIYIEIPEKSIKVVRVDERREQYNADCEKSSGIETVPLDTPLDYQNELTIEDIVPDSLKNVEDEAIHEIDLEILRRAIKSLSDEELCIVRSLYLSHNPISLRELSRRTGIPLNTLKYRKEQVFDKLKKFS